MTGDWNGDVPLVSAGSPPATGPFAMPSLRGRTGLVQFWKPSRDTGHLGEERLMTAVVVIEGVVIVLLAILVAACSRVTPRSSVSSMPSGRARTGR